MRERERAGLTAAGICLAWALLRALAPSLPFDWISLALVLAAVAAILLPYCLGAKEGAQAREARPENAAAAPVRLPPALEAQTASWPRAQGPMAEALSALYRDHPFSALCAARGMLGLLQSQGAARAQDEETLRALAQALDEMAEQGAANTDEGAVEAAFEAALRALGRMEV